MTPRTLLITALKILALAGVGWGLVWATGTGRQGEHADLEDGWHSVAVRLAEAVRSIETRNGEVINVCDMERHSSVATHHLAPLDATGYSLDDAHRLQGLDTRQTHAAAVLGLEKYGNTAGRLQKEANQSRVRPGRSTAYGSLRCSHKPKINL